MSKILPLFLISLILIAIVVIGLLNKNRNTNKASKVITNNQSLNPLSIEAMREKKYPGSDIKIEETLPPTASYNQYIVSYKSDNLKIYALLTVPIGVKPKNGWPVIIFNHGYIPPEQYSPTERYVAYVDAFARNGYIVFKSNYRGNGKSEGQPEGAYYSPGYATDVLNAVSSIKRYKDADSNRIGMWGHSMGGNITLRDIVVDTKDIKAAVIWGGVVGSYDDLLSRWQRRVPFQLSQRELAFRNTHRAEIIKKHGTPEKSPAFWNSIDPTRHLSDINTPIQLHTGGNDEEVPVQFSVSLQNSLQKLGKIVEYYNYPGGDHNISSPNFELAMQRSLDFFNKYLKGGENK